MSIKWIFFDVGFTLVSEEKATIERSVLQCQTNEAMKIGLTPEIILNEMVAVSNEYKPQFKAVMSKYGITEVVPYNPSLEEVYSDCYDTLEKLSKNYHLGILANQVEGLKQRLIERKMDKYFEIVLASFEEQLHKPDLEYFKLAIARSGVTPEECLMVGDRLDNDIYPAKKLGMKTIRIRQGYARYQEPINDEYKPDYDVYSLSEIPTILQNIEDLQGF